MYEEVVIISLDESNFRSETFPARQWEFDANFIKKTEVRWKNQLLLDKEVLFIPKHYEQQQHDMMES
jgi:hypothetical protein